MTLFDLAAKISLDSSDYEKGLNEAEGKTQSFGSKLGSALGTVGKVAAGALTAATGAVTAFAGSSVSAGMDFDSAMSQVAATMGTTVDSITELRDFAKEMGSTTAFSATQSAEALNYMALAGYDAETSMSMLPNVLNLAAAGGMDLARASDMITDASSALGLSIDETTELVDKMATASSKSNTSVAQLGDAILTVGGTAKNLAGGTTELATALGILADNGIKGAEGGTALRNIILSLSAPTDKASDAMLQFGGMEQLVYDEAGNMRELNDIFADLNGILGDMQQKDRTELLNTLFNKVDLKSASALLANTAGDISGITSAVEESGIAWDQYKDKAWMANGGISELVSESVFNLATLGASAEELQEYLTSEYELNVDDALMVIDTVSKGIDDQNVRWDELSGYIDDVTISASEMADIQLNNLAGDITLFQSALEGAQIAISDTLTPSLREFVQFGSDGISQLTAAFEEGGLSGAMDALGGILAEGIAMITEKMPEFIEAGMGLLSALGQGIMDNLPQLLDAATQIVISMAEFIIQALPDIVEAGLQLIITLAEGIAQSLPELIPTIVDVVLKIVEVLTDPDNIGTLIDAALAIILALADGLIQALPQLLEKAPEIIMNLVEAFLESIPKILEAGVELIGALIEGILSVDFGELAEGVKQKLSEAWEKAKEAWANVSEWASERWEDIKGAFATAGEWFGEKFEEAKQAAQKAWEKIGDWFGERKEDVQNAWQSIDGWMGDKFGASWEAVKNAFKPFVDYFKMLWENVKEIFSVVKDVLSGDFEGAWEGIKSIWNRVVDFFKGIWDGIKNAFSNVGQWFKNVFDDAVKGIKQIFNDLVKGAVNWGRDLVDNFIGGIKNMWGNFTGTLSDMAGAVASFLGFSEPEKGPLSNFHTFAPDMMNLFIKGIKDNEGRLQSAVADAFDFQPIISDGYGTSGGGWNGNMSITINTQPGQNAEEIANYVERKIINEFTRRKMVSA